MIKIVFKDLQINHLSNSSGVFSGENFQTGWKYSSKKNDGFGSISGNNNTSNKNYHIVKDSDILDSVHTKSKNLSKDE